MALDARDLPDRIQWHEGMLLAPQHFQQADLRNEQLVHYHVRSASRFHWGVRRLAFDPVLLANGTLRVKELEAVMPDGLIVTDPASPEEELELDLTTFAEEGRREPLAIHLAVPSRRRPGEPMAGTLPRFRSVEGAVVLDEASGEGSERIPRLRPRAELLVGETAPEKYTSLPVARVAVHADSFALTDYVPPHLELGARPELTESVEQLVSLTRERAVYLAERVRATGAGKMDTATEESARMVERLVRALPPLEAVLAQDALPPFSLYMALCSFAGSIAGVVPGQVPPVFPGYDHNRLRASFSPVVDFCHRTVERVRQAYRTVSFRKVDGSFRVALGDAASKGRLVVGAVVGPDMNDAAVESWFMESRIGSVDRMEAIRRRRIRGAPRQRIQTDDTLGVVAGKGLLLFRVDCDEDFVEPESELEVSHPGTETGEPTPAELVLYTAET